MVLTTKIVSTGKKKWKLQVNFVFYKSMLAMSFIQVCFFFDVQNTNMKDYIFILTLLNIFNNWSVYE